MLNTITNHVYRLDEILISFLSRNNISMSKKDIHFYSILLCFFSFLCKTGFSHSLNNIFNFFILISLSNALILNHSSYSYDKYDQIMFFSLFFYFIGNMYLNDYVVSGSFFTFSYQFLNESILKFFIVRELFSTSIFRDIYMFNLDTYVIKKRSQLDGYIPLDNKDIINFCKSAILLPFYFMFNRMSNLKCELPEITLVNSLFTMYFNIVCEIEETQKLDKKDLKKLEEIRVKLTDLKGKVQKYLKIKEGSLFSYFFSRVNFTPLINVGILNMEVNLVLNKICFVIEGDIWKQEFEKFANIYLLFLNGETDYFNNVFQSYFFHNNRSLEISHYTSEVDNYKTINSLTSHFISNPLKDLVMSFVTSRKDDIVKFMREDGVKEAVIAGKESLFFTPKDSTFMENLFIFSENDSTETDVVEPLSANATNETSDLSCSEDVKAEIAS